MRTACTRPSASGRSPPGTWNPTPRDGIAVGLIVIAFAMTAPINDGLLTAVVAGYVFVTLAYTLWLKHEPVIDLVAVASGFVFRAIAGGVATGVPLSDWFLIVAGAGSLFIVTGKRHAEQVELGSDSLAHRSTLGAYSTGVPRLRAIGRVRRDDHRLLPVGVRERQRDRRRHVVSALDRAARASRCCATRSSSRVAGVVHPRKSC